MRVIAGEMRGSSLKAPKGDKTRPTTDRVKESLFSIIAPTILNSVVLDLFAGSGALSIEALSRGATKAILIERDPGASSCIRENLLHTHLEGSAEVLTMPVTKALEILHSRGEQFSLFFADPPYAKGLLLPVLKRISELSLAEENSMIVAEHGRKEEIPSTVENFACVRQETYGDTTLSFYRYHTQA